jgi:FixJ family two-component response regulator
MQNTDNNKHRIFVVDDEEIIATTLAMILRNYGFDATPFSRPLKALEASRLSLRICSFLTL